MEFLQCLPPPLPKCLNGIDDLAAGLQVTFFLKKELQHGSSLHLLATFHNIFSFPFCVNEFLEV